MVYSLIIYINEMPLYVFECSSYVNNSFLNVKLEILMFIFLMTTGNADLRSSILLGQK